MRILTLALSLGLISCTSPVSQEVLPAVSTSGCVTNLQWAASASRGADVYAANCSYCHQRDGGGVPGRIPTLAGNKPLLANPDRGIGMILVTQSPAARIHGMEVQDLVAALGHLDRDAIADVMSFVFTSWDNCGPAVTPADVDRVAETMPSG
ncbi:MAG: cytochrome c [Gammaproteobacteria bacterium]|nr:cytochrome c [Gammaproteobacteria bacterium]